MNTKQFSKTISQTATWPDYFSDGVNVVIDDFVCTGTTIRAIYDHLTKERSLTPSVLMVATGAGILSDLQFTHIINCSNY